MCGIVGEISDAVQFNERGLFEKCNLLRHRGPDDEGSYFCEISVRGVKYKVALGHRRLRVLDLSERARCPMSNDDGSIWVTYNGEIYNFKEIRDVLQARGWKFRSHSDTEVLIKAYEAWGIECLNMFNGMFAFGIWDGRTNRLLLARDQLGIKPLYYKCSGKGLLFASELKAVPSDPGNSREIDPAGLAEYLALGYVPGPRTIYKDVRKLQPAHYLLWRDGDVTIRRYWTPFAGEPAHANGFNRRERTAKALEVDELSAELLDLLRSSVRRQLISDVPLGAFLSGGLDSSLIVALMSEVAGGSVKTFSMGFRGSGYYDERGPARRVAKDFGADHLEFETEPEAVEDLHKLVWHFDEPFADSSAIPLYHLARAARRHVTVALSGTGGDDLFGGYRRYAAHDFQRLFAVMPGFVRQSLAAVARQLPATRRSKLGEYALFLQKITGCDGRGTGRDYLDLVTIVHPALLAEVLQDPWAQSQPDPWEDRFSAAPFPGDRVNCLLYRDFHTYLPDDLLVKEDRMTMAHGLESRVPFLDRDVVEFAWRLPGNLKVRGWATKYILKKAAERVLPREIVHRTKHGFAVPLAEWFRGGLREMAYDVLLSRNSGFLKRQGVGRMLDDHQRGKVDHSPGLWALLVLRVWEEHSKDMTRSISQLRETFT